MANKPRKRKYTKADGSEIYVNQGDADKIDLEMLDRIRAEDKHWDNELRYARRYARRNLCTRKD